LTMLLNTNLIRSLIVYMLLLIKPILNQGVACYKCMTTDPKNDRCADPFSSILNPILNNCQVKMKKKENILSYFVFKATFYGKNGTFPARFCVKISGRVTSVDDGGNMSYLNTNFYFRTCIVDNIMESTKALETSGNFRLKGLNSMPGTIRLQGYMSLCTLDGCNSSQRYSLSYFLLVIILFYSLYLLK